MRLDEIIGRELEEKVTRDTLMLLRALNIRFESLSSPSTPVSVDDLSGIIASRLLCQAGLAEQEPAAWHPWGAAWFTITDKGRELVARIDETDTMQPSATGSPDN